MARRLLVLNVALGIASLVMAVGIARTVVAKRPVPPPPAPRAISAPAPTADTEPGDAGPGGYSVIAARNLFNPSRGETMEVAAAAPVVKPFLHGVVLDGAKSRAFLEDPTFKRVAGYSVGDAVGGGTIQKIANDRVVITRPDGLVEILLQDPSKPRPAPTAVAAQTGPAQAGSAQPGPAQAGSVQAGQGQAGPGQAGPGQVGPGQAGPPQVGQAQPATQPSVGPPAFPQIRQRIPLPRRPSSE